jgi:hypothetical protein
MNCSASFLLDLEKYDSELRAGNQIEVIYCDVLKDERRPIEKRDAGKSRLFASGPLHQTLLLRRYGGAFLGTVPKTAAHNLVAVGVNVHSVEWTIVANRGIRAKSIVSGDYSCFDGKMPAETVRIFVKFLNWWYNDGPVNERVRVLLFEKIWRATRINGKYIYTVVDGDPSGNAFTSILNSFCNIIMLYTVLTEDHNLREDEFDLTTYGDDNLVFSYSRTLRCSDLAPHIMRRFGMEYTHFSKESGHDPYDSLATIRYLGREFVKEQSVFRAPLSLEVVYEMTYWRHSDEHADDNFVSTANSFFIELSHHGKEVYTSMGDEFLKVVGEKMPHLLEAVRKQQLTYGLHLDRMYDPQKRVRVVSW